MHLLFVANFAADTGYAWATIEAVFRRVGERLVRDGHRVTVCYAAMPDGPSPVMRDAPFGFTAFPYARVYTPSGLRGFLRLLRERGVDALYLTDRETWSWRYALYRAAGVRRIVLHDRTSGERTPRAGPVRVAKRVLHRLPGLSASCYVAVSDYVRARLRGVAGAPPERTFRVYNGIDLSRFGPADRAGVRAALGLPAGARIVFCSGRAQPYKGFQVLVRAVAALRGRGVGDVALVHCGDGPYLGELREMAAGMGLEHVRFLGRRGDVPWLLGGADAAAVPSLWAEAFGLTVVEAMAAGVPLVATRTGGIPELVEEGRTGLLVPPGDEAALADALRRLLTRPDEARAMAERARREAHARFSLERSAAALYAVVSSRLRTAPSATRPRASSTLPQASSSEAPKAISPSG